MPRLPALIRGRSLRARLTGAAALSIFLSVAVLGSASVLIVEHRLNSSLDRALRQRAIDVARLSLSAPELLTEPGTLDASEGSSRQLSVEVVDQEGRIVARSASLGGRLLPGGALLGAALRQGRSGYATRTLSSQGLRLYVAPLPAEGGPASGGAVLVGSGTQEIHNTLKQLGRAIAMSALGAAVLGALGAALLTGRGLRPLRRLSLGASRIEQTGDATERLPAPQSADEVGELAATLNRMLATLERARETERRFLADASHELRTPLTSLRGNAAYIARHGANPEVIADIENDTARLGRLLDDLLALEREQGAARANESVALDELAQAAAERSEQVRVEHTERLRVAGERGALERALENLVANAVVHGPSGGEVRVAVRRERDRALLSVEDDGPGLSTHEEALAFGRFWRGEAAAGRPGTGLGLAIVRATAERHGGRVTVRGSRFTLELPALPEPDGPAPAPRAVKAPAGG